MRPFMKKSELIAAIMNNENRVPPKQDPSVTKLFDEMQQGQYSEWPVVMYGADRQMQQLFNAPRKTPRDDDKKPTECSANLNQLDPLKYTWAWEQYLSAGSTARASSVGIFAHVDAGKTTTPERIREIYDRLHRVGEVHDGESTKNFMIHDSPKSTFGLIWSHPK